MYEHLGAFCNFSSNLLTIIDKNCTAKFIVQWNLAYPNLKYPGAQIIQP